MSVDQGACRGVSASDLGAAAVVPLQSNDLSFDLLINDPYGSINRVFSEEFSEESSAWCDAVVNRIEKTIVDADWTARAKLPCLNTMKDEEIRMMTGRVVRFRGMVRETMDPQMYCPVMWIKNMDTDEESKKCFIFRELSEIQHQHRHAVNSERPRVIHTMENLYAVSVPGENDWVSDFDKDTAETVLYDVYGDRIDVSEVEDTSKQIRGCYIKIFRTPIDIMLNDVVEFYGIVSCNPSDLIQGKVPFLDEFQARDKNYLIEEPSPPIEYRFQVFAYVRENSNNENIVRRSLERIDKTELWNEGSMLRVVILDFLTDCLMGDRLTTKFVLCNLFSSVTARIAALPIGAMPLIISSAPAELASFFNEVLMSLMEKTKFVDNVLEKLGTHRFIPAKNYENDRLQCSFLQLSCGTHVLLKEEMLTPSLQSSLESNEIARHNLDALQLFMQRQMLPYSFGLSMEIEFNHDCPVLVFSTAKEKSLLNGANITVVPFKAGTQGSRFQKEIVPRIRMVLLSKVMMNKLREFIILTKENNNFSIDDEMHQMVSEDWIKSKSDNRPEARMTQDDFHRSLTLCRLWSKIQGIEELSYETWQEIRSMEIERKARAIASDLVFQTSHLHMQ